tara:strand:+ start:158 stop:394 length:237 start_codon:yes stop_codon:yes gene_type:complete
MNNKSNTNISVRFKFPPYKKNSRTGRITVTGNGEFSGMNFSNINAYESFFTGKAVEAERRSKMIMREYNKAFGRNPVY